MRTAFLKGLKAEKRVLMSRYKPLMFPAVCLAAHRAYDVLQRSGLR